MLQHAELGAPSATNRARVSKKPRSEDRALSDKKPAAASPQPDHDVTAVWSAASKAFTAKRLASTRPPTKREKSIAVEAALNVARWRGPKADERLASALLEKYGSTLADDSCGRALLTDVQTDLYVRAVEHEATHADDAIERIDVLSKLQGEGILAHDLSSTIYDRLRRDAVAIVGQRLQRRTGPGLSFDQDYIDVRDAFAEMAGAFLDSCGQAVGAIPVPAGASDMAFNRKAPFGDSLPAFLNRMARVWMATSVSMKLWEAPEVNGDPSCMKRDFAVIFGNLVKAAGPDQVKSMLDLIDDANFDVRELTRLLTLGGALFAHVGQGNTKIEWVPKGTTLYLDERDRGAGS